MFASRRWYTSASTRSPMSGGGEETATALGFAAVIALRSAPSKYAFERPVAQYTIASALDCVVSTSVGRLRPKTNTRKVVLGVGLTPRPHAGPIPSQPPLQLST
jgi:hypothetical protein